MVLEGVLRVFEGCLRKIDRGMKSVRPSPLPPTPPEAGVGGGGGGRGVVGGVSQKLTIADGGRGGVIQMPTTADKGVVWG